MITWLEDRHALQGALLGELAWLPDDDEVSEWKSLNELLVRVTHGRQVDPIEVEAAAEIEAAVEVLEDAYSKGLLDKYELASVRDTPMRITSAGQTALSEWNIASLDDLGSEDHTANREQEGESLQIDSSLWTGLSRTIIDARNARLVSKLIRQALDSLPSSGAANSEIMQAAALLKAAQALVDAPEPPSEMIWTLISKAADVVGLVGLFYTIFVQATC